MTSHHHEIVHHESLCFVTMSPCALLCDKHIAQWFDVWPGVRQPGVESSLCLDCALSFLICKVG